MHTDPGAMPAPRRVPRRSGSSLGSGKSTVAELLLARLRPALAGVDPELGGEPVHLIWIRTDAETLRHRLRERGLGRDSGKLGRFDDFVAAIRPGQPPPVDYLEIDNRLGAEPLERQLAAVG